ncbi:hypothetical protein ABET51_22320 [Metabacillus fastidiosus]|uniref:hypothetical protein n=1 Tax=Metabacillus fastidiosus TaxID=1458 RepID=UPI003D294B98
MKWIKIISIIAIAIIIFLGGYFTGSINNNEASTEIRIGYKNSNNPDQIDYSTIFTNIENQDIVDNFIMIYLQKEKITNVNPDTENPDIYIDVISPKRSVGLIDSKVSFTNEGAIIGKRSGESWDEVEYYKIDKEDANYIKENIDYKES